MIEKTNIFLTKLRTWTMIINNHEIWQKCECGGEEDLRMTFTCSGCGAVLYEPQPT